MKTIPLTIIYQTKTVTHHISELQIETIAGIRSILPGHEPLYAALKHNSKVSLTRSDNKTEEVQVLDGIAIIDRESIKIILSE